jgi:hypothetical protein
LRVSDEDKRLLLKHKKLHNKCWFCLWCCGIIAKMDLYIKSPNN